MRGCFKLLEVIQGMARSSTKRTNPRSRDQGGDNRRFSWLLIAAIAVAAVIIVVILIQLGRPDTPNSSADTSPYANLPRGVTDSGLHYLGDPDAPVTVREYEDFGCPNCRDYVANVEPSVIRDFIATGQVQLVSYPVAFVNNQSLPGAEAAACAAEQGKYWEYRHLLFANLGVQPFVRNNLVAMAGVAGVDTDLFGECLDQDRFLSDVMDQTRAANAFGITGTPTFEINGSRYQGYRPYESDNPDVIGMRALIEAELSGN